MTNEEVIKYLNIMWEILFQEMRTQIFKELEEQGLCDKFKEAHDMAIEALKYDTVPFDFELYQAGLMDMPKEMIEVLDKIRTEIEQYRRETQDIDLYDLVGDCLAIFDKYMPESEKV